MSDPVSRFQDAMTHAGIVCNEIINADGQIHSFHVEGDKPGSRNGRYQLFLDGIPAGWFGTWKLNCAGDWHKWCDKSSNTMTQQERELYRQRMAEGKARREQEQAEKYARGRTEAARIWDNAYPESGDHRYLRDKGVKAHGIRTNGHTLIIPLRNTQGVLHSIQSINPNGDKDLLKGGKKQGHYHAIGKPDGLLYICEGYVTGASVYEASGHAVAIAFDAGNLKPVAIALRSKYPDIRIIIAGDNDQWTEGNPGTTKATKAAQAVNGEWVVPEFKDLTTKPTDWNDLASLEGVDMVHHQLNKPSVSFVSAASKECEKLIPLPLPSDIPAVEPFEPALLPESFRPWIEDISDRIQCPPDFPAIAAMIALSAVIGRQCGIRPKQYDDWLEVPNLWGAVVGRPGVLKTPAIQEAMKPLNHLEAEWRDAYKSAKKEWGAGQLVAKEQAKVTAARIRKALKDGTGNSQIIAEESIRSDADKPARQRLIANDATVEKLGEILSENPRGVLIYRDELMGWLRTLEKQGREADRGFYLEAWNGKNSFTYDRIARGTTDIEAACVSILGSIQPGPLSQYMGAQGSAGDDGLMQRFQLLVWPDTSGEWRNIDRWPDAHHKNRAYDVFTRLNKITSAQISAQQDDGSVSPFLRFSPEAQELFNSWREDLEKRLRSGDEHQTIEAHLSKYRGLIPSLALCIHLADIGHGPVSLDTLEKACAWGEYLESHTRRVYSPAIAPDMVAARALAQRIQKGNLPDKFTLRDVYRPCWAGLSNMNSANQAVSILIDYDWLTFTEESTGGRPTTTFHAVAGINEVSL